MSTLRAALTINAGAGAAVSARSALEMLDESGRLPRNAAAVLTEQEGGPPNERYPDPTAVELRQEWHEGWRAGELYAQATSDQPPADLPATLATVDDVRAVCEAGGLERVTDPDAHPAAWTTSDRSIGVTIAGLHDREGVYSHISGIYVLRIREWQQSDSHKEVARIGHRQSGVLLWHAIQAARSTS